LKRREFLRGTLVLGALGGLSCRQAEQPWHWATLEELKSAFQQGRLTPEQLLQHFFRRIDSLNPSLGAVLELSPRASGLAAQKRAYRSPLSAVPVLIKDNLSVADGLATSAGSLALEGNHIDRDAEAVARLRRAGMIPLGRANMSEWSNLRAKKSLSGWSARGGQCRNPYALDRSPSGSSSGCAVAVAAGLVPLALGTETMGSITCPASVCGIVGLKPTRGLIPCQGMVPCVPSFDCPGPMARTVRDLAFMLQALVEPAVDYVGALRTGALRGARLGVARQEWGFDPKVDEVLDQALELLRQQGAELVDPVPVPSLQQLGREVALVFACEMKQALDAYLGALGPEVAVHSLEELIRFNLEHRQPEGLDFLDQELLYRADLSGGTDNPHYARARQRLKLEVQLATTFRSHRLEAILAPTTGPAWPIDRVYGDRFPGGGGGPPALAGLPHLTLPAGLVQGLPVGLSLYGPERSEARLLALAADFERARGPIARPTFPGSLP